MQQPPILCTMSGHCDQLQHSMVSMMRTSGTIAVGLLVLVAGYVAFAYSVRPEAVLSAEVPKSIEVLSANAFAEVSLKSQGAVVINVETGYTEYAHNAEVQLPLASLTKVPLVLAVSEVLPLDSVVTIQKNTSFSSTAGLLRAGSTWYAKDLFAYTLVASSNDVAVLLANVADTAIREKYPAAPRGGATVWRMNDLVKNMGLSTIYFLNTSGLDESATQSGAYGSARDVALLFAYAASTSPDLFKATSEHSVVITSREGAKATASNTDDILDSLTGITMGKTGFTDLAGGNLVIVFNAHRTTYVAAVLGSTEDGRFSDMLQLVRATHAATTTIKQL
jgi:serine-type D-Ala-D-Ala carboxypeptidase (penicillin-binding protein 5/6)